MLFIQAMTASESTTYLKTKYIHRYGVFLGNQNKYKLALQQLQKADARNLYDGEGVHCDICGNKSSKDCLSFWHCPKGKNSIHPYGYDVCDYCVITNHAAMDHHNRISG